MISVTITGTERVKKMLSSLQKVNLLVANWMRSGNPDKIMQKSFIMNFLQQGRPDKWEYLAESTEYERERLGFNGDSPILQRTGSLMNKVTDMEGEVMIKGTSSQMTWGIDQLDSATKKKFGPNQIGKGRSGQDLPVRPMIGFQKQDGKKLVTDLRNWILKTL